MLTRSIGAPHFYAHSILPPPPESHRTKLLPDSFALLACRLSRCKLSAASLTARRPRACSSTLQMCHNSEPPPPPRPNPSSARCSFMATHRTEWLGVLSARFGGGLHSPMAACGRLNLFAWQICLLTSAGAGESASASASVLMSSESLRRGEGGTSAPVERPEPLVPFNS